MANPSSLPFARPPASFIGATIEVADLVASTAFHRRWLPLLGFTRIGADADRVLWARRDQHLMLREAAVDAATGGAILALAARDRAQVDALHAHLQGIGAEITQAPAEEPYTAPGHYGFAFRCPDGTRFEIAYRWEDLPEIEGVEHVRLPGNGVTLGGYLYKPEAGVAPHPALVLLHGFGRNAWTDRHLAELAANSGYKVLSLSLRGWLGSDGDNDQGGKQVGDVIAAIDWLRRLP
ncbi:MAG: hypothetical protein FJX20_23690, partial [Alphaproteobacteria bacterium]|nr:hypothetical protein [Alphaproteobacteria bacterium]